MKVKALLLTLGHNSSAILVEDGKIVCGYEEERLTKIKSDSRYPEKSIELLDELYGLIDVTYVMISHWFTNGDLPSMPNKYYNPIDISLRCPTAEIISVNKSFTHHDAHMHSANLFAGKNFLSSENVVGIVCDGFGTMGECLSIYRYNNGVPTLWNRTYGFGMSLGLFYQYATSYLGMKENQDEYKLLGYEPKFVDYLSDQQIEALHRLAADKANIFIKDIDKHMIVPEFDPMISISALPALKLNVRNHLDLVLKRIGFDTDLGEEAKRAVIARYVQVVLENVFTTIINAYKPDKLVLSGGVFMNVKLNNHIINMVDKVCIMPLCGDQGAALGIYHSMFVDTVNELPWPNQLNWGLRKLDARKLSGHDKLYYYNGSEYRECIAHIIEALNEDKIVNLVKDHMEFGARALCNTSTLALPTEENVKYINKCNSRSTIMPMAPVVPVMVANSIFNEREVESVHRSLEYMICAVHYNDYVDIRKFIGAAHMNPNTGNFTGRPQLTADIFMLSVLYNISDNVLINTSFNVHGVPIVFDTDDIISSHEYQMSHDDENRIITIVLGD